MNNNLVQYIYGIADNALILGQRLGELCGHGPSLETDIAMTNMSLDLLGQTRSYYQYAAQLLGENATEDTIAFLRREREYKNVLLVEQPNTDFAYSIARQFLFDIFHLSLLEGLKNSEDETLAAIAEKGIKEVSYHTRFSSDWIRRLGDGTTESHDRIQAAIDDLWVYTDELFHQTDADKVMVTENIGVDTTKLKEAYYKKVSAVLEESTLNTPVMEYFQKGGKQGIHSEHMGYLLADMQYMQRAYPNMNW
ncbi:phenylacetate-CoA oxygenase, PaaI subunit [Flavobacterium enshiense DK69]|uniref:Phenylacetic acid degradation protein n=1 Tax=Flavobacterium enshiense DK69 TaxID=1107311 RepID=V6SAD6_9FLAO|nr:1,2-phenylacetyl-CoA epoxidase subunit PaaC [Flavobacterium enshiense]ESU23419.1 phenylacetate-CoA oxygenase, PaaI subunit [Flavobacterium enshiense DK69]KGO96355.1 phenylacetic acid degradation protein [Flavobacterium enshiense DK69]